MTNLQELKTAMQQNHPSTLDQYGSWRSDLPTFGGPEPDDTTGIWSWDATSLLVGTCADDLGIVARPPEAKCSWCGDAGELEDFPAGPLGEPAVQLCHACACGSDRHDDSHLRDCPTCTEETKIERYVAYLTNGFTVRGIITMRDAPESEHYHCGKWGLSPWDRKQGIAVAIELDACRARIVTCGGCQRRGTLVDNTAGEIVMCGETCAVVIKGFTLMVRPGGVVLCDQCAEVQS